MWRMVFIIPVFCGCIAPVGSETITSSWALETDRESAWNAIVAVYTEQGYSIQTIEKASGVIATHQLDSSDPGYFACDHWQNATPLQIKVRFSMLLQEVSAESSKLTINTTASVLRQTGLFQAGNYVWSPCQSTEVFEQEIVDAIRRRITTTSGENGS